MSESRWVTINSEADVISARLYTRQMAIDAGLRVMDQARISLAVSSLAHLLKLGQSCPGQIVINRVEENGRGGIQVVWMVNPGDKMDAIMKGLDTNTVSAMVDEINVQVTDAAGITITAMKWA